MTLRGSVTQNKSIRNTSPDDNLEEKKSGIVIGYSPIRNHFREQWVVVSTGMAIT